MKTDKFYSSLNVLLDSVEGTNLLLEYFAEFSKRIFYAPDFQSIVKSVYKELRKIYVHQKIEFVLLNNYQEMVKFEYDNTTEQVTPLKEFTNKNTLYHYVLENQHTVLTNNYKQFCENLGVHDQYLSASSWIGVPMAVRGKILGLMAVWDDNPERYLRIQDKQFLSAVSDIASFSIENIYLYEYIAEKNGSYRIFDSLIPKDVSRQSTKIALDRILKAIIEQHKVQYTGIFLRSQYQNKYRLLNEYYEENDYSYIGLELQDRLVDFNQDYFTELTHLAWYEKIESHPLDKIFKNCFPNHNLNSALVFPFDIENTHYGVWILGYEKNIDLGFQDEIKFFKFILFMLVHLIEKKALLEWKKKQEAQRKNIENMNFVDQLVNDSAHHLNNILSVLIGKSQILGKKLQHSPLLRDIHAIEQAAVDAIEAVSRLQNLKSKKSLPQNFEILNINDLVQQVVEIDRSRFEHKEENQKANYQLKLSLGKIYPIEGDAYALREVMLNLINNAIEAMPNGGELAIQTTSKDNKVIIFVSDTGIGISDDMKDKIFKPFFSTKGDKGRGLGLSIVSEIIQKHRGKIHIDSILGKSTTFMIELPFLDKDTSQIDQMKTLTGESSFKVLLVEDEIALCETLAEMLEETGYEVTTSHNANDAILKFQKYQCDVVLTDFRMPGMDGCELAKKIKSMNKNTPILLITGWNQMDREFIESNKDIDGLIEKPFNMTQIEKQFKNILNKNSTTQL